MLFMALRVARRAVQGGLSRLEREFLLGAVEAGVGQRRAVRRGIRLHDPPRGERGERHLAVHSAVALRR